MTTLLTTARTALGGLLTLALLPALWPGDAAAHTCDDPFSTDLIAGRTIDAGDVTVCNDDTTLTVTYDPTFPWCLLETNLHVATIPDPPAKPDDNIPQNRSGNPIPGHFAYGDEHDCVGKSTFEIPLDEIDGGVSPGDTVAIAAHAEVDDGERAEGAWGEGARFAARGNWAMYFTYAVQAAFDCAAAGGVEVGGACWFAAEDESCAATCSGAALRYDEATATYAGSGGTLEQCVMVAEALGFTDMGSGEGDCAVGLGCIALPPEAIVRCSSPPTTADAAPGQQQVFRLCACK